MNLKVGLNNGFTSVAKVYFKNIDPSVLNLNWNLKVCLYFQSTTFLHEIIGRKMIKRINLKHFENYKIRFGLYVQSKICIFKRRIHRTVTIQFCDFGERDMQP